MNLHLRVCCSKQTLLGLGGDQYQLLAFLGVLQHWNDQALYTEQKKLELHDLYGWQKDPLARTFRHV